MTDTRNFNPKTGLPKAQHHDYNAMADEITNPIIAGPDGIGILRSVKEVNGRIKVTFLSGKNLKKKKVYTVSKMFEQAFMADAEKMFFVFGARIDNRVFDETASKSGDFTGKRIHTKTVMNPNNFGKEIEDDHARKVLPPHLAPSPTTKNLKTRNLDLGKNDGR